MANSVYMESIRVNTNNPITNIFTSSTLPTDISSKKSGESIITHQSDGDSAFIKRTYISGKKAIRLFSMTPRKIVVSETFLHRDGFWMTRMNIAKLEGLTENDIRSVINNEEESEIGIVNHCLLK
ncbi:hypothetical protein Glove_225g61 [Diversispora epigaea]|uniref:Uncharacterized protein n=1 Tax=Diversispora epigaea TaxID=1348612 RepID=A0A397IMH3_9GLOM|nr:hypothetical protein Glove_225g61 [Diversispora epigaea]